MKVNLMQDRLISSKFVDIVNVSLSIALFCVAAFGQQPDRGFQSANAYAASGLEAINTTNGNLVMNIPIAKLPAGRGGNPGYAITLQYNSKLWESKDTTRNDGSPDEYGNTHYTSTALGLSPQGGWRLQTAFSLDVTSRLNFESPNPCYMGDPVENLSFIWKVQVLMPDGSVKQFFPETGRDQFTGMGKDGYANIDINGTKYNASTVTVPACAVQQSTTQISTSGMNYITLDGSRIRLFVPYHVSNIAANSRNWKMYFPDGTIVENLPPDEPTVAQRITDRNGNSVKHIGGKIIDDLGRFIEFLTDSQTGDQIVRVKGVGGENVDTKIRWTDKWVNRMYRKTNAANAPTNERYGTALTSIAVVSKITLPAQVGQQSMDFEYFADNAQPSSGVYTNGWGELKKVTVPTGATSEYQYLDDGNGSIETTPAEVLDRHATRKDLKYDEQYDGAAPTQRTDTWLYGVSRWASSATNPNGSVSNEYQNYFSNSTGFWENGLAYRSVSPDGSFTERLWAHNLPFSMTNALPSVPGGFEAVGNANAFASAEMTTITDLAGNPSLTAIKEFKYDKNGNALEIKEYDWVPYSSVPRTGSGIFSKVTGLPPTNVLVLKRKTVNTYYNQAADAQAATANSNSYSDPASPKLKNVIKSTEIQNENGTPVSRSEFFY